MSLTVTGSVIRNFNFSLFLSSGFVQPQTINASLNPTGATLATVTYTAGTGSLQGDTIYVKPLTLAAATTTIDLTSLTDQESNALNFARIREGVAFNPDVHDCKVYMGASNGWAPVGATSSSPSWARANNGLWNVSDPTSTGGGVGNVVGGSSKTVTFDPGANTITIYILFFGSSVA
jgi:hypothetical protein